MIGIGGAGTSALAQVYREHGHDVSGSDVGDGFYTKTLEAHGVTVHNTFQADHISDDVDAVVYSTAIDEDNVELVAAKHKEIRIRTYPEAVGALTQQMKTIAVCGTHGKTTTTALLAEACISANVAVTAIVGSRVVGWGSGAAVHGDDFLIVEADEYQNKLALYSPYNGIVTSVDYDHPDFFADVDTYKNVFVDFIRRIPDDGYLVAYGDDADVRDVVALSGRKKVVYYGTGTDNDFCITKRTVHDNGQTICFTDGNGVSHEIFIQLYGAHNACNALAAWIMARNITNDVARITDGISACRGTKRRFERRGTYHGALLIDDYAHHPREITATLSAVREIFPDKKIIAAFHPHTFTRTQALLPAFAQALQRADTAIILDIYGSAREEQGTVSADDLVTTINREMEEKALYVANITQLAQWMHDNLSHDDVFLTLGAGDVWQVYDMLNGDDEGVIRSA